MEREQNSGKSKERYECKHLNLDSRKANNAIIFINGHGWHSDREEEVIDTPITFFVPAGWTAGKTLLNWYAEGETLKIGAEEFPCQVNGKIKGIHYIKKADSDLLNEAKYNVLKQYAEHRCIEWGDEKVEMLMMTLTSDHIISLTQLHQLVKNGNITPIKYYWTICRGDIRDVKVRNTLKYKGDGVTPQPAKSEIEHKGIPLSEIQAQANKNPIILSWQNLKDNYVAHGQNSGLQSAKPVRKTSQ